MLEEIVVSDGRRVVFNAHGISEAISAAFDTVGYAASGLLDTLGGALVECAHRVCDYSAQGTHRLFRFMFSIAHDLAHLLLHCLCAVSAGVGTVETYDRDAVKNQDAAIYARMGALTATFLGSVQPIWKDAMIRRQNRGSSESVSEDDNRNEMYRGRGGNQRRWAKARIIIKIGGPPYVHSRKVYRGFYGRIPGIPRHDRPLCGIE